VSIVNDGNWVHLNDQTEGYRIARDIQREHEQWLRDNECMGKPVSPAKDWGFVNTVSYSVPCDINIETKQYDVSF